MYVGKIVEISETDSPFKDVKNSHPEALLSAVPVPHPTSKSKKLIFSGKFLIYQTYLLVVFSILDADMQGINVKKSYLY